MTLHDAPELTLVTGAPANGGSCVARYDGRVIFVRHALPGERVRARIVAQRQSYWHAEVVDVIDPSPGRIESQCPIAGVHGAGCCDLAFANLEAARAFKAQVVAEQLQRLGGYNWLGLMEPVSDAGPTGWRTRVRLAVGPHCQVGFHRYHSHALVTDLRCGQLPTGMLDGLNSGRAWPPGGQVHVVLDDDGRRHVLLTVRHGRRITISAVEGDYRATQRVGARSWRLPVTAFWQAHRDAAGVYSNLVADWAQATAEMTAWDLYGGAGVFAAALGEAVGESGQVLTVDSARTASRAAQGALADLPQVAVINDSVRRALQRQPAGADIAVLDPPRTGAGRDVINLLAAAGVPRIVHIGCEAASFGRDIGLYIAQGYAIEKIKVFDAFPLTHHVECVALLTR
ncbi:class I SAM-dependent RNA methyltransferase [Mycobacterium simiae]|uniref:Class I SAM-dependent RNA methyltransferase n=1 Tax=Mycobacterium simiae TaxID=1784 RepID=A0A5B1BNG0_MYCSI|nr:class I SAM-dependent RNA methyltransferase [Mycobacterium simiae]KAA1249651.1 class I SAM-dependent RNA methyltransferase [Mycobacterium simiae]